MDYGRNSYLPSLKREVSAKRSEVGRKSTAVGFIGSKRFKSSINHKELK
jgi:hypothetical protein